MPKGVVKCGNCVEPTIFGKTFEEYDINGNALAGLFDSVGGLSSLRGELLRAAISQVLPTVKFMDVINKQEFTEVAIYINSV